MKPALLSLLLVGCSTWAPHQRLVYDTFIVCNVLDYAQTVSALKEGEEEQNRIFGKHPTEPQLVAGKVGYAAGVMVVGEALSSKYRTTWLVLNTLGVCGTVIQNHVLGVRIAF